MGQSGSLYIFTQSNVLTPAAAMGALVELFPGTMMFTCTRHNREDTSWARFQDETHASCPRMRRPSSPRPGTVFGGVARPFVRSWLGSA